MLGSSYRSNSSQQLGRDAANRPKYSLAIESNTYAWARANGGLGSRDVFDELDETQQAGSSAADKAGHSPASDDDADTDNLVTVTIGSDSLAAMSVMRRYRHRHPGEIVLTMNLAGTRYLLKPETIFKRAASSFLYRFALMSHADRVTVSAAYFDHTKEYFFERSAIGFEPVYRYYATGSLHKPVDTCLDDFLDELQFWELPVNALAPCCWSELANALHARTEPPPRDSVSQDSESKPPPNTEFDHLPLGALRKAVWELIEVPESSVWARLFAVASILFVLVSISGLVLGSIPELQVEHKRSDNTSYQIENGTNYKPIMVPHPAFNVVEYICIAWFTMEYCGKILVAAQRWKVFKQTLNVIDLFAIVPFYFEMSLLVAGIDTENLKDLKGAFLVIRILRVLRVMRIFKLGRYSAGLQTFALTLLSSMKQLGMMSMVLMTGVIFFSTLVYFLEKDEPDTLFTSIPAAFWWCIVTMTTVGYGDVVPTTVLGKLVASGAIACGVLVLALPITIIVDNFVKVAEEQVAQVTDVADGPASGTPRGSASTGTQHVSHMQLPGAHAPPASGFGRLQRSASMRKD